MPSFLTPLRHGSAAGLVLRNTRQGSTVAEILLPAFDSRSRNRGLLGRDSLPPGTAMIIAPTNAIHTFFMKFAIDAVFVARDGSVAAIRRNLRPWRIAWAFRAYAVVELGAGAPMLVDTRVGDRLAIEERSRSHG